MKPSKHRHQPTQEVTYYYYDPIASVVYYNSEENLDSGYKLIGSSKNPNQKMTVQMMLNAQGIKNSVKIKPLV